MFKINRQVNSLIIRCLEKAEKKKDNKVFRTFQNKL